jgi:hypothetical protein
MKQVGRTEKVSFPEIGAGPYVAKIDTGAYGNAIHVDEVFVEDGRLHFFIEGTERIFEEYDTVVVKSSIGKKQKRYSVYMTMKMGHRTYKVLVSLASRRGMKYPVLIGRRFLRKFGYMVDVSKKNINDQA